jgi:propanol-preferring alcohol dehydrogenase
MRAAVLHAYGRPIALEDRPAPVPGEGEVLIRIHACGVCHSDLHLAAGDWDLLKSITKLPVILGHEIAGTVAALGTGVSGLAPGDRVGVPWLYWTCGTCEYCASGRENLCLNQQTTGCTVDGGFAEFITARATHAVKLPDAIPLDEAAPLMCAGLTVYRALKTAATSPGNLVAVFGVGGLGHLAVQYARALGARVCAMDITPDKLALARACGAEQTVDASREPPHRAIRGLGGAHVAIVTAASADAYTAALRSMRRGGTVLLVAMTPQPFSVSPISMVSGELRIVASAVGTRRDLDEALALAVTHGIRCRIERRPLTAAAAALADLHQGRVLGRIVLNP